MHISKGPFRLGPWTVDPSRCLIRAGQETHRLEPKVMDVLCVLAHARGDVVSRPEILDTVWSGTHVTDGVLTRAVSLLRTALDDGSGTKVIETVPRRGYRLAQPVAATAPPDPPAANEGPRSIAVLPFADFSAQSTEHLADGLTDVLIAELARLRALRVISRTSVMAYGRGPRRLRQIGDELGADLIVEGSVQKLGGELRITAQLIDAKTDDHLWAESYVRPTEDLMRLLSDVASEIAQEVRVSITAEERRAMALRAPSPRVVDTYLRGRHLWSLRSREAFLQAIDLFEQVLQINPHHVESMSAMADCHTTLALYGAVPATDAFPKALRAAQKALECDAGSPDANRAMAAVHLFWSWQLPEAEAGFRRCLERAPSDTQARLGLADTLAFAGRSDEAIREIRTARKLDPLDPGMGMNVGDILLFSGRFRDAVEAYLDTSRRSPAFARVYRRLATAQRALGDLDRAEEAILHARKAFGSEVPILLDLARLEAARGEEGTALELIAERLAREELYVPPVEVAQVYAELGDADAAFFWLERARTERAPWTVTVGIDSVLVRLSGDPRYGTFLDDLSVPAVALSWQLES